MRENEPSASCLQKVRFETLWQSIYHIYKYTVAAFFLFQYNLITCLDDIANFSINDLTPNIGHTFALNSKMCVMEEQDLPKQIIFGAQDPNYTIHLETAIKVRLKLFVLHSSEI